jgi:hypothetical protein
MRVYIKTIFGGCLLIFIVLLCPPCCPLYQVTGVGYNGAGEVLLHGEEIHGFSNTSVSKIVEVRNWDRYVVIGVNLNTLK